MSEKRFIISKNTGERFPTGIIDVERQTHLWVVEVVDLLNELVKDNEELGISIKLFEDDIATKDKKIEEQQATIKKLQDLCGESDGENAKLRIENKELQEEIKLLKPTNVEQYEQIVQLQEENEQLRQMIKENVFQRYCEGSLADLEFKAIAYDDIVRVEMPNELEPRVIVYCKQGKKENIMSYCQMVIPFGVYYEIKEVIGGE